MELMCTPTAAVTRPVPPIETWGDDVLSVGDGNRGFGDFTIDGSGSSAVASVRWIDELGEVRFIVAPLGVCREAAQNVTPSEAPPPARLAKGMSRNASFRSFTSA
jgi:hypothetical protein